MASHHAQADLLQVMLELVKADVRRRGPKLDALVANLGDFGEGAEIIAGELIADGVCLKRDVKFPEMLFSFIKVPPLGACS